MQRGVLFGARSTKTIGLVACALIGASSCLACQGTLDGSLSGDTGSSGDVDPSDDVTPVSACVPGRVSAGPSPLRRLSRFEYNNTVRYLLDDNSAPANAFPLEEQSLGFGNDANVVRVSLLLAEAYIDAAQQLAENVVDDLPTHAPCATEAALGNSTAQEQCVEQLVDQLAPKAYRRPLAAPERERLLATFRAGREFLDFEGAVGAVIESLLMAPQFLYRIESGTPVDDNPGVLQVDSWGLASRLSYLLWASMPDDELLLAAGEGRLVSAEDVRAQAERMYDHELSRASIRHFNRSWLEIGGVDGVLKDATLFPDFTPEIASLLRIQTETFTEQQYFGGGTLQELLTAPYTYMNLPLADFYGVAGPTGNDFERVDLDPTRRAGVLTEASILSLNATADRTDPIHRGVFVRRQFLCSPPPPPPPEVTESAGTVTDDPNATERERIRVHREDPGCGTCHSLIDPVGLAFENFDATGRWRDLEAGRPVDASGGLPGSDVDDGPLNGAVELAHRLAESQQVQNCVANNWFRFANGRGETREDACSLERIHGAFSESGGNLRELVLSLTQSDAFLYRAVPSSEDTL